jgi:repressor LexA
LNLADFLPLDRRCFALRVRGDSMACDHITDGDFVIIEKKEEAENGDVVVAILENGEMTLKKYFRDKNRIRLQSLNGGLQASYPRTAEIRGVVIGVLRRFAKDEAVLPV